MKGLTRAVPGDCERVETFQRAAYARTEAVIGVPAIPLEWDYGEVLRNCEVWLHEYNGDLSGILILQMLENQLYLKSIATDPDRSRSGIGGKLMAMTFERARLLGLEKVVLITNRDNPAASWYRKLGFEVDFEEVQNDRIVLHMSADVAAAGQKVDNTAGKTTGVSNDGTA